MFGTPSGQSNFNNGSALELGVKIIPNVNGSMRGIRFYKQGGMSGTHVGTLWSSGGSNLASATFTGESASGWQEVMFSSPVSVTAGTTYVASVTMNDGNYIATSNYFTSDVVNGPLTAPSSAGSGGNGVFNTTAGAFPTSTFNATNYWIDVSFFDTTTPNVSSTSPANGATGVIPGETIGATFDQDMDASSLSAGTFTVKDQSNNVVPGTVSYSASTKTASFVATDGFTVSTTYTATIKGGVGTVAKNGGGVALASDYTWNFTIAATKSCPCTLKNRAAPNGSASFDDTGGLELGTKIKVSTNGYITALRFYKPITSTETTHTGHVWDANGNSLATVSFANETDYGWQEAKLSSPLRVNENQLYILSYGTTTAVYQATAGGLNTNLTDGYLTAYADNSPENAATGSGNRNGVFTTTAGSYPSTGGTNGSYYWIDAVFSVESAPTYPLAIGVTQPTSNAYGVLRDHPISATFNRPIDGTTVTNSTFRLFTSAGVQVAGTASYNSNKGEATFTPTSNLINGEKYTAKLSASVADPAGTTLGSEYDWSFTVGSPVVNNPAQGSGGPLLVITSSANHYSPYYAEILHTEGLNYFDVKDIATVDAATLSNYQAVVLAETSLTQAQADMLNAWVTAGGNLVAMRPDAKLASLLGLTDAGTTRTNQYLLVNTATAPGTGIVGETIQFKGTANNYTLSGATAVATLYSDASTSTSNPAVTTRSVGSNGGTAAAFAYDLAKSVIALHQGNQAWAGQERDGSTPIRANDLFFGAKTGDVQPDWVDLNKFHIPQADEQQRLLANMLINATKTKRPLPRFWYLPGDYKAAMIMAGDDHGLNNQTGTEITMNNWLNESAATCSVEDWQCVRASHYIYTSSALTNARALQYHNLGFEIGDHVSTTCANFASYATLGAEYTSDLATWRAKYTSLPNQVSHRYHCYVWSDWDSQAKVDVDNGIRFDLNYVNYPGSWFGARAPLMTGSGMDMRLTNATGDMLDVRQGTTNFDDQASSATNVDALLNNATGAAGYYGIFGTHYDMSNSFDKTLYNTIKAHNVPMITSKQALTWLDGRNSSSFSGMGGANGQFTFTINPGEGAYQLKAMLPTQDAGGTLNTLTLAGANVTYQTQSVKGVSYAVFDAQPGSYTATYSDVGQGGGGTGGTGGGTSGSSGGTSSPASKPRKTAAAAPTTTPAPQESPTPTPEPATAFGSLPPTEQTPEQQPQPAQATTSNDSSLWLWLLAALVMLIIVFIIWFVRRRQRRREATLHPGPPTFLAT